MPLILNKQDNNIHILVWKSTERLEELILLSPNVDTNHLKSEKRKIEFICSRILLNIFDKTESISYSENGNPQLKGSNFISISHSGEIVCIAISDNKIGIDTEKISDKTLRVQSKFTNTHHINLNKEKTTLIWCIKEAVFKWHTKGNIDFKKDIFVPELKIEQNGSIEIEFRNDKLKAHYMKIENSFLSYVCK